MQIKQALILCSLATYTLATPSIEADGNQITVVADDGLTLQTRGGSYDVAEQLRLLTNQISTLVRQQSSLTSQLSSTQSQLTSSQSELSTTQSQLVSTQTGLSVSMAGVQSTVTNLSTTVGMNIGLITHTSDDIIELNERLDVTEERLDLINTTDPNTVPRPSCLDHYNNGSRVDGTYMVGDANTSQGVFCDMRNGGWTLVAMAHTCTQPWPPTFISEPAAFFQQGYQNDDVALSTNRNRNCGGVMSHHPALFDTRLSSALNGGPAAQLKVDFHAENDFDTVATWYKAVPNINSFQTLFGLSNTQYRTQACKNQAMTTDCRASFIGKSSATSTMNFGGMYVYVGNQYDSSATPHMRLDGTPSQSYTGVCSSTLDQPFWPDSYGQHWGNGFRLYLK